MGGGIQGIGIDLPCNTWSIARRAPQWSRMPRRLRDPLNLWGFKWLTGEDLRKTNEANSIARSTLKLIRRCNLLDIPGYLEGPRTSRFWLLPQAQRLIKRNLATVNFTDQCQYSVPYRKPTCFLVFGPNRFDVDFRRCSPQHGLCSATHRAHVELTGKGKKEWRTRAAQTYPQSLADQIFKQILAKA